MERNAKILVNLDWLSVSYVVVSRRDCEREYLILTDVDGYKIEKCSGTNVFNTRYLIYDNRGLKVLTWLADPKSGIINKDICLIEFSNHTLYTGEWVKLWDLLSKFHTGYVHRLSRVDVCGDFQCYYNEDGGLSRADVLSEMFNCNSYYVQGKRSGCCFFDYSKRNDGRIERDIKQFSWGGKTSQFKWKLYNKTKEILEESHKFYIVNLWKQAGFDVEKNTWRLECSISQAGSIEIKDVSGANLLDNIEKNIVKIYKCLVSNKFVVRLNEMSTNSSRNKEIDILNFGHIDCDILKKPTVDDYMTDDAKGFIRKTCKIIENSRVRFIPNIIDDLYNSIYNIVNELGLYEWFYSEFGISIDTYYFEIMQNSYGFDFLINNNIIKNL